MKRPLYFILFAFLFLHAAGQLNSPVTIDQDRILDISGRTVFETANDSKVLFISDSTLAPGMYIVRTTTAYGNVVNKVVLER